MPGRHHVKDVRAGLRRSNRILTACAVGSGAAGLIHELLWTRRLELLLGTSLQTAAASLAATMGGMALGAWLAGRREEARGEGARAYAAYEFLLAGYALALPLLFTAADSMVEAISGLPTPLPSLLRTLTGMLVLLPAAMAMGATFPPLVADRARANPEDGTGSLARLYAANTLGAFAGTLTGGMVLRPWLGTSGTLGVAVLLSALAGLVAWRTASGPLAARSGTEHPTREPGEAGPARGVAPPPRTVATGEAGAPLAPPGDAARRRPSLASPLRASCGPTALLVYALGGFAGLGYQVLLHRMASLWIGGSSYAFTMVLAVVLLGLAIGAAGVSEATFRQRSPLTHLARLQGLTFAWALALASVSAWIPLALARLAAFESLPFGMLLAAEFLGIAVLVLPGAACMGATLPTAARALGLEPGSSARIVGRLYAWNAVGSVVGALGVAHLLVPWLGLRGALLAIASTHLVGLVVAAAAAGRARAGLAAATVSALAIPLVPAWDAALLSSGPYMYASSYRQAGGQDRDVAEVIRACGEVIFHRDGAFTTATVRRAFGGLLSLQVNGKTDASNKADQFTQTMIAHLPLLVRPEARSALLVGLGSGVTAGAMLRHPIERLDVVEIAPEVVEASRFFDGLTGAPLDDSRTRLFLDDARAHLRYTRDRFDVLVSEPSNPWIAGIANLFTREYFELARSRLNPGGAMVQWVQAYSTSPEDFRSVVGTFLDVFPQSWLMKSTNETDFVLLGLSGGPGPDATALAEACAAATPLGEALRADGFTTANLSRLVVADPTGLRSLVEGAARVTDDHPFLEFTAPRNLYRDQGEAVRRELSGFRARDAVARSMTRPEPFLAALDEFETLVRAREAAFDLVAAGRSREARPLLEATVARMPEDQAAGRVLSSVALEEAEAHCRAGRHREAADGYARVLVLRPDDLDARNNRAHCLVDLGRLEEARTELVELLVRAPDHRVGFRNLSRVFYRMGRLQDALGAYLRSLDGTRPSAAEWKDVGELYRESGDFPRAAFAWKRCLAADPEQPEVRDLFEAYLGLAGPEGVPEDLASGANGSGS